MPESGQERIAQLSEVISRLEGLAHDLSDLTADIRPLIGGAARLGTVLIDSGGTGLPLSLRRHEVVTLRETATLLEHLKGLSTVGVTGPDLSGVRDLLASRAAALTADLASLEEMRLIRMEPGLDLAVRGTKIDPEAALAAFRRVTGTRLPDSGAGPERVDGLFLDYTPEDLPHEDQEETTLRIAADPILTRFTHQELLLTSSTP